MKAFLMYRDRDFDITQQLPWNEPDLMQDLDLSTLLKAMANEDTFLFDVAKTAVLTSLHDVDSILYRQDILRDCLKNPDTVRALYAVAVEALENERKKYWGFSTKYPASILHRSIDVMAMLVEMLKKLRGISDGHAGGFQSDGFQRFFTMVKQELDDAYFETVLDHLQRLKFRDGILMSAELGTGNKGTNYTLRELQPAKRRWFDWLRVRKSSVFTFAIAERDEAGAKALSELKDRGINLVANALAQSAEHILSFFTLLRIELAFYIGCLNLHERLTRIGAPTCFPLPVDSMKHSFGGLYDICLALGMNRAIVGNDLSGDGKNLVIITGPNQGGKSTFLRSIALSQLMMQCGMYVPAESFRSCLCSGVFTHYKREEDATMQSGKFDEELLRMSRIVDNVRPDALIVFNESFAATNEREGSEVASQIVHALVENRVRVFFVTHLYEFAHRMDDEGISNAMFLRAERRDNGARTFKIVEGKPLTTSHGEDLYKGIFGVSDDVQPTRTSTSETILHEEHEL
jgi:DNA mismatch repair ATPase MutS